MKNYLAEMFPNPLHNRASEGGGAAGGIADALSPWEATAVSQADGSTEPERAGPEGPPRPQLAAAGTSAGEPGQGLFPRIEATPHGSPTEPRAALEVRLSPKRTLPAPRRR